MATRKKIIRDPLDSLIEEAFRCDYHYAGDLLGGLERAEQEVAKLIPSDPARAADFYVKLLDACESAADDVDDSDGELGTFAGQLYCGLIRARQAANADPGETVRMLLQWMDDDEYGFTNDLNESAPKALNREGLLAFEAEVRARLEKHLSGKNAKANYFLDHWGGMLRSIYVAQRDIAKYIELTTQTGLTTDDCEAIATLFQAKRKIGDALEWVDRGLALGPAPELRTMRRALLLKLRRGDEALDSAWAEFKSRPSEFTYAELMRYVPTAKRKEWKERAMVEAEHGHLGSLIPLYMQAKEIDRLAARLDRASEADLHGLSHYTTEPAANLLAKAHPGVAARVYRALCMRLVDAGKSNYYREALASLAKARDCYYRAGADSQWRKLAEEIRRNHGRKSSFMPGFERIDRSKPAT